MEAVIFSETLINLYENTFRTHRPDNLKSNADVYNSTPVLFH
jgi:hypothetical protein